VCNRSIVFAIDVTGDILAIFNTKVIVVDITAGFAAVLTGAFLTASVLTGALIAVFFSFTRNVSLCISSVSALVTLLVVAGVVVSGHF
jgi:hypothetical protein